MASTQTWIANTTGKSAAASLDGTELMRVGQGGASFKLLLSVLKTFFGVSPTLSGTVVLAAGTVLDVDYAAVSATGNDTTQSATITKACGTITTGALTTAAGATTAVVLTLTGVVAGDPVLITKCGGTNTRSWDALSAIATTDTITLTVSNLNLISALNGTVKLTYFWLKA